MAAPTATSPPEVADAPPPPKAATGALLAPWRLQLQGEQWRAVVAATSYCVASLAMSLSNKAVLSGFGFRYQFALTLWQAVCTVGFVFGLSRSGVLTLERIPAGFLRLWLPANVLFVAMLVTSQFAVEALSVPMATIFKNLQTVLTVLGDRYFYANPVTPGVAAALLLMSGGSVAAGANDLAFSLRGYVWMSLNVVIGAAYVLYLRWATTSTKLSDWTMVFYNNLFAIPMLLVCAVLFGELPAAFSFPVSFSFLVVALLNGLVGVMISFASMFTIKATSPATYSILGSLTKIPLVVLGIVLFHAELNSGGAISVCTGLAGGVVYSVAKMQQSSPPKAAPPPPAPAPTAGQQDEEHGGRRH